MRKNLFLLGISFLFTLNVCSQSIMTVNDLLKIRTAVLKNVKGDMTLVNILKKEAMLRRTRFLMIIGISIKIADW